MTPDTWFLRSACGQTKRETKTHRLTDMLTHNTVLPNWDRVTTVMTRRRSDSAYIRQVHDNVIMYTSTGLHMRLPSNVRAQ